jgi:hypothetical protein
METSNALHPLDLSTAAADTGNDEHEPVVPDMNGAGDYDSDGDRKPAAIENNDGNSEGDADADADSEQDGGDENDDSEDNASSDDNNDKDTDDDGDDQQEEGNSGDDSDNNGRDGAARTSPDGRQLSQYELMRQERIKRNKQYLAALGLEGASAPADKSAKRKRKKISPPQKRSSLSRRTKAEQVSYTEPPASVASLIRTNDNKEKKEGKPPKPASEIKAKDRNHRMEKFVYLEFKSLKAHKKKVVMQAEKNVRNAGKEVNYWKKRVKIFERQEQRKLERTLEQTKITKELEDERRQLGGGTAKELLQDIDNKMPDILSAVARYDAKLEVRLC